MNYLLFYIDKSIGNAIETSTFSEVEFSIFQSLAVAVQKGRCIVCGEYHSLFILSNRDDNIGYVFKKILSKYATHRAILEKVNPVFCICKNEARGLPSFLSEKTIEIQIDQIINCQWDLFEKCALVCENQNDCVYYSLLGLDYCNHHSISEYTIDFTYQGGGGQTTAIAFENMVRRERRPALCVVDSDKKHGNNCPLGKTCVDVQNISASFSESEPPFRTIVLPVHEVENIIPLIILSKVYQDMSTIDSKIQLLKKLARIDNGRPLLYFDLKQGHSDMLSADDASHYWNQIVSEHQIDLTEFNNSLPAIVDRKYLSKAITKLREIIVNHEVLEFEECIADMIFQLEITTFSRGCVGYPMYA